MKLPDFVYLKAFWEALSLFIAGLLALLVVFNVVSPTWALSAGAIYSWFISILALFNINPQLKALREARARLLASKKK